MWKWFSSRILFVWDAETIHRLVLGVIRALTVFPGVLRWISGARAGKPAIVFGLKFRNSVGLAAGFDKNAEILAALPHLGFGFSEIGTVTPKPQAGNPRPRMFRDSSKQSLFNRMGFNGAGAEKVAQNLRSAREMLPEGFQVGVNIGKNRDTPASGVVQDYVLAIRPFESLADYVVINVSSPNTPGLRALQTAENLKPIVLGVSETLQDWKNVPPLLLKLSPELDLASLEPIVQSAEEWGVKGWVLTNTVFGKFHDKKQKKTLEGGWSGGVLTSSSCRQLELVREISSLPIISVGGILSREEASKRFKAGASLIQIYSGWVFNGPRFPGQLVSE